MTPAGLRTEIGLRTETRHRPALRVRDKLQLEPRGPGEDCSKLCLWAIEGSLAQQATDDVAGWMSNRICKCLPK
jgi:hypothetical protein